MRKKLDFSLLMLTSFVVVLGVSSVQQVLFDKAVASELPASVYTPHSQALELVEPLSERSCPVIGLHR
jgi:hypothetical protein